ncbi:MAG: NUDIX hydrolase [Actinobacteria bacterium]|nr:NUDIX hydrolase [Actinomycetota bacterium]
MKYGRQVSAGGVLVRPAAKGYEVAVIRLKGGKVLALPKGLVDEGESPEEAALREVREETGMEGEVVAPLGYIRYYYYSKEENTRYFKLVHFFLLRYRGGSERDHDWEVEGVEWLPLEKARTSLSYKGEREVLDRAWEYMEKQGLTGGRGGKGGQGGEMEGKSG